jgi:hypothetical protein
MATKGSKGPWTRTTLRVASIDAAQASRRAPGVETSGPRQRDLGAQTAAWTEAPRLEAPPRRLPPLRARGVYGRHARPRSRMRTFAPFAANQRRLIRPDNGHKRRRGPLDADHVGGGVHRRRGGFRASARKGGLRTKATRPRCSYGHAIGSTSARTPASAAPTPPCPRRLWTPRKASIADATPCAFCGHLVRADPTGRWPQKAQRARGRGPR